MARHVEELERAAEEDAKAEREQEDGVEDEEQVRGGSLGPKQKVEFLIKTLKVPEVWIYSARVRQRRSPHLSPPKPDGQN